MKSFLDWTRDIARHTNAQSEPKSALVEDDTPEHVQTIPDDELPDGVWFDEDDGKYYVYCRSCEGTIDLGEDTDLVEEFDRAMAYCGKSRYCMP